ncbi:MAG: 4-hydroxybenzoate octaprenyltransferase [Pseudomonadota bacterium]
MASQPEMPDPTGTVADAVEGNWVDNWAPERLRPFLRLSRADRPIGTWLLLIPCLWGLLLAMASTAPRLEDLWIAAGCGIGAWLMRGAGCTWNDIQDREFDAHVARTKSRPLPSGQVTVRGAFIWLVIQSLLAFGILLTFHPTAIWLGIGSLALVALYPFAKRFTWWPQVFLGLAYNWGAMLAWAAHTGSVSAAPVALYLAGISWTLFYDTIYGHQDAEDDELIGVKSTSRLFGENSRMWLRGFMVTTLLLLTLGIILALANAVQPVALVVALGGVWAMGWHMTWQLSRLDTSDPESCKTIFRSNRDAGLIPAAFICLVIFA